VKGLFHIYLVVELNDRSAMETLPSNVFMLHLQKVITAVVQIEKYYSNMDLTLNSFRATHTETADSLK
jgi:hypothetical protein